MPKARSTQGCGPRTYCAGGGDLGARLGFEPGPLVEPDREGKLIQGPGKRMSFPIPSARPSPLPHLPVLSWAPYHTVAYQQLPMPGLFKLI